MIVLGLGFGDEGKGLTTSFLCSKVMNPIVVRFNGGHQAGHTVVYKGKRHIFSSFGSGTLQGVPTYWSSLCTLFPTAFMNEYQDLDPVEPKIFVHPLCPITTPYEIDSNRWKANRNKHGSVGVGFGETIHRQENHYRLYAQDLGYPAVLREKLRNIAKWHGTGKHSLLEHFISDCLMVSRLITLSNGKMLQNYDVIYEGAQGILLDQQFGFFPNVTRSHTTSKRVGMGTEIYYVTRTYQTRHGNGFLSREDEDELILKNNENETNKTHPYQGEFRIAPLDVEMINYALMCDSHYSEGAIRNLVVTCNDQLEIDVDQLLKGIDTKFNKVYLSYGDSLKDIKQYK